MSRKSMQTDIDFIYGRLDQQQKSLDSTYRDVKAIRAAHNARPDAVAVAEFIAPWQIKMELLNIYKGDVDAARSAFDWLEEGAEKVTVATEGEQA